MFPFNVDPDGCGKVIVFPLTVQLVKVAFATVLGIDPLLDPPDTDKPAASKLIVSPVCIG